MVRARAAVAAKMPRVKAKTTSRNRRQAWELDGVFTCDVGFRWMILVDSDLARCVETYPNPCRRHGGRVVRNQWRISLSIPAVVFPELLFGVERCCPGSLQWQKHPITIAFVKRRSEESSQKYPIKSRNLTHDGRERRRRLVKFGGISTTCQLPAMTVAIRMRMEPTGLCWAGAEKQKREPQWQTGFGVVLFSPLTFAPIYP